MNTKNTDVRRKTTAHTKETFLKIKFPCSTYDNMLKIAFSKKGKGFLISWVVEGFIKHYGKQISTKYLKQFIISTDDINNLKQLKDGLYLSILRSPLTSNEIESIKNSLLYDGCVVDGADKATLTSLFNKAFDGEETFYINEDNLKHNGIKKEHYKLIRKWVEVTGDLRALRKAQTKKVSFLISEYGLKTKRTLRFYKSEVFTKQRKEVIEYAKGFNGNIYIKDTRNIITGEKFFKVKRELIFNIEPKPLVSSENEPKTN